MFLIVLLRVTGDLMLLVEESKNVSLTVRTHNVAELKRALFTIGVISKHFEFVDILAEKAHVCILLDVDICIM